MLICRWIVAEKALDKSLWNDELVYRQTIQWFVQSATANAVAATAAAVVIVKPNNNNNNTHVKLEWERQLMKWNEWEKQNYANAVEHFSKGRNIKTMTYCFVLWHEYAAHAHDSKRHLWFTCNPSVSIWNNVRNFTFWIFSLVFFFLDLHEIIGF